MFCGLLWSEYGTYETVKARVWPWLSGQVLKLFSPRSEVVKVETREVEALEQMELRIVLLPAVERIWHI